jgi:hypothetical protein
VLTVWALVCALDVAAAQSPARPGPAPAIAAAMPPQVPPLTPGDMTMETFLDRLMLAESGGRDTAANPRSSAVGPFQFITATFLDVVRRHFADETAAMTPAALLALRTDRAFARRAAEAYTRDNALLLAAAGLSPTWPHLRLAFFAGGDGAVRVLKAEPDTPVASVLGRAAVAANPFMSAMSTRELIARAARDLQQTVATAGGLAVSAEQLAKGGQTGKPKVARIPVQCDLELPSCKRWLALAKQRLNTKLAVLRKGPRKPGAQQTL